MSRDSSHSKSGSSLHCAVRIQRKGHGEVFDLEVDLEFAPGITILFGHSGSGKSTTLQAIAGLVRPDSGRISLGEETWFDSERKLHCAVHRRHVAYVFQSLALFPHMTAEANVAYGLRRKLAKSERHRVAMEALERVGVDHLARRRPRTFSGGEAQRVALARALAMHPRVILLDEPFSALDRDLRIQLATLVRNLVDELDIPLIQVTHNHGEARALGDHIVRMEKGRVVQSGTVNEVLGDARALLGLRDSLRSGRIEDIGKTPMPMLRKPR